MINLSDFDTIIFDLDFTIWRGNKPQFWARLLIPPYAKKHNRIYDKNENYIEIDVELYYVLEKIKEKRIGFVTRGGTKDIPHESQPITTCLKMFGIQKYFGYNCHILLKEDLKSSVFKPEGKTIFIDDNILDLTDIADNFPTVKCLNRNSFKKWTEILN